MRYALIHIIHNLVYILFVELDGTENESCINDLDLFVKFGFYINLHFYRYFSLTFHVYLRLEF